MEEKKEPEPEHKLGLKESGMKKPGCFACSEHGHYKSECPKRNWILVVPEMEE